MFVVSPQRIRIVREETHVLTDAKKKLLILADDHPRVREVLEHVLSELHDSVTLYTADDPRELLQLADKRLARTSDLTVIDITAAQAETSASRSTTADRSEESPLAGESDRDDASPLMVVSMQERGITAHWFAALPTTEDQHEDGAHIQAALDQREVVMDLIRSLYLAANQPGVCTQPVPDDLPDLESLMQLGLTQRQAEVLRSLAQGMTNKEIARQLHVSEWTVRHHVSAILEKLDVSNRGRAAMFARRLSTT